jgi:hypothetical protein
MQSTPGFPIGILHEVLHPTLHTSSLYIFPISPKRKFPQEYIPLYLIILSIVSEEHTMSSPSLCMLLYPLLISYQTLSIVLCSQTKFCTVSGGSATKEPSHAALNFEG